jgi:hypothetical protein
MEVDNQHHAPTALTSGKKPGSHCEVGWMGLGTGLEDWRISRPTEVRTPNRPTRNASMQTSLSRPLHTTEAQQELKLRTPNTASQAIRLLCACSSRPTVDWVHVVTSLTNPEFYTRYTAFSTNHFCTQYVIFTISNSNYGAAVTARADPNVYLATQLSATPVEWPMWLHHMRLPYQTFLHSLWIEMNDEHFCFDSNCWKVYLTQSDREYWIKQTFKMRDVHVEFVYVFHKLLTELGKFFEYFLIMPDTVN